MLKPTLTPEEFAPILTPLFRSLQQTGNILAKAGREEKNSRALEQAVQYQAATAGLQRFLESGDDATVEGLYKVIRGIVTGNTKKEILTDAYWPAVLKIATVSTAETDIEGKYKIDVIPGGKYYAWCVYSKKNSLIEWIAPLVLDSPGEHKLDLHNNKAALILNDQDD